MNHTVKLLSSDDAMIRLGGYGVVFGGRDLYNETFLPGTDYGDLLDSGRVPVFYDHTQHPDVAHRLGAVVKAQADDKGLWIEAQLDRHAEYVEEVLKLVEAGALGWSSGSAGHLVRKSTSGQIEQWPIIEMSLTPTPAEPRTLGVEALKSRNIALPSQGESPMSTRASEAGTLTPSDSSTSAFKHYLVTGRATKDMNATVGSEGGYLLPPALQADIVEPLYEASVLRMAGATILRVEGSAGVDVPIIEHSGAATVVPEADDYPENQATFRKRTMTPYKIGRLTKITEELLLSAEGRYDIVNAAILPDAVQAFAAAENGFFFVGTGTSEPRGVVPGSTLGYTASSATAITYDDVIELIYSLPLQYRGGATFLASDNAAKKLRMLKDGSGAPLWQPSWTQGEPSRLMGYPIYTTAYMDDVEANAQPVIFGDLSYFWIVDFDNGGITTQRLDQLYAATGHIAWRWRKRVDAGVVLGEAIKHLKMGA